MASFVDEAVWAAQDWKWDAQNLTATPAEAPQGGKAARKGGDTTATKQGCQVDGCTITVGNGKDYHSRYKICEFHLKAHVVQKNGLPHRFCQQCGKFQPLEDFDGDKRSCRARLDKHNARRRRQREMAHMLKKTGTIDEKASSRGWSCCYAMLHCYCRRRCSRPAVALPPSLPARPCLALMSAFCA
jgi:hypothetical protein